MSEPKGSSLAPIWWVLAGLLLLEVGVRAVLAWDLERVLIIETLAFLASAVYLYAVVRTRSAGSSRHARALVVSAVAFALGGVRTGLWAAGVAVQWANLTIFVVALILLGAWWRRRRSRSTDSD